MCLLELVGAGVGVGGVGRGRVSPRRLRRWLIASDVVAIVVGVLLALVGQQIFSPVSGEVRREELLLTVVVVPVWVLMMGANHLFLARAV